MVTRASAVLLLLAVGLLLAGPAHAGEITGHVFNEDPTMGEPGIYDEGLDAPASGPEYGLFLEQIGERDDMPRTGRLRGPWFTFPEPDGSYVFGGLPDNGIFQLSLPSLNPTIQFDMNIVTTDPASGMKMAEPVPAPPLGITVMPPTPTEVDIPILAGVAPAFVFASPPENNVLGVVFVDANTSGQTGGNGVGRRGSGATIGPQYLYGEVGDGIEVVLQPLDAGGQPTGTPLTTIVGSAYTFTPENYGPPEDTFAGEGIFMFLDRALADGEAVRVSVDPTQLGLAGLLPVAPTTVVRTYDMGATSPDEPLPVIEFRFQPASDLAGRVTVEDTQGVVRPMPGVTLRAIDMFTLLEVDMTTTDSNGDYQFEGLFNAVYRIEVVPSGGLPPPFAFLQIDKRLPDDPDPADVDFAFDQATCPDGVAPTLTVPADIVVECAGAAGTVATWPAPTATDDFTPDDQILISSSAASGDSFPIGQTTVTVTATDWCGNVATETFTVTVLDRTPPEIACALGRPLLWPARGGMLSPGLTASAMDVCDGAVDVVITVFSDEGNGAAPFSPDAMGTSAATLALRSERAYPGDGRVYLIRITATDRAGNTASLCKSVYVPVMPFGSFILMARAQAAAGEAACAQVDPLTGVPQGFVELLRIGGPPPIEPN